MRAVKAGRGLPSTSKLQPLKPVLDEEGVLRCDGRLRYAEYLPWETCYPIILPRNHWVTTLIIKQAHEQTQHAGTNQVLAQLSVQYWIISAKEAIKEWGKECMRCRRRKLPQPSRLWPLCHNYVCGSLYEPSAKHLLTLGDLSLLNKEEARPVRRGTFVYSHA